MILKKIIFYKKNLAKVLNLFVFSGVEYLNPSISNIFYYLLKFYKEFYCGN